VRDYRLELAKAERYEYGSYTPGVKEWGEKWESRSGRRVLLYAYRDYSGSFYNTAEALNRHSDFAARLIVFARHPYGYDLDLVMPNPRVLQSGLSDLLHEADIIHIKDETGFFTGSNLLPKDMLTKAEKPMVFTHYGGYARAFEQNTAYRSYVRSFPAVVAMTPDLVFEWLSAEYIPHPIDTDRFPYSWTDGRVLAHSPSTASRKGTAELLQALEGLDIELDLIQNVSHSECMARKARCNVFFDQAGHESRRDLGTTAVIGWYGNSALEAAVHGIPTIAHLSEEAFRGADRAGRPEVRTKCMILNTAPGVEGIRRTLSRYLELSPEERRHLSERTRTWIETFHSYQAVGERLSNLYNRVLNQGKGSD